METAVAPEELEDAVEEKLDEQQEEQAEANAENEVEGQEESAGEDSQEKAEEKEPPTVAELEHAHLENIKEHNARVRDAAFEWEKSKTETAKKKKRYDSLSEQLQDLIAEDPRQHRLPFGDSSEGAAQGTAACDEWKKVSVKELGLPDGLITNLEECDLDTLGKLKEFWDGGGDLKDKRGIGEEKAAKVIDAFSDYGAKHPELFGEQDEAEETAEEQSMTEEEFYAQSCDVLGLKKKHLDSLVADGFESLQQLASFWDAGNDLEGIGDIDKRGDAEVKKLFDDAFAKAGFSAEENQESAEEPQEAEAE